MASVTEQAKEALLGTSDEPQLSQQTRAEFMKYALQDPENGEKYLDEEQFINAIAPRGEDYVCIARPSHSRLHFTDWPVHLAQNQAIAVRHPLPSRGSETKRSSISFRLGNVRKPPSKTRRRVRNCLPPLRSEWRWCGQL